LTESLEAAVEDQMKGSSSSGLLLSGGLDSRLVASVAPKNTTCFTMADYMNPEMRTAQKVTQICNLEHVPIIRDEDWTANIVEESAVESLGLWHWQHMTFKPMKQQGPKWQQIDRVMLGMGFDTFFKGNQVESVDLWRDIWDLTNTERIDTLLLEHALKPSANSDHLARIMQPDALNPCRDSYRSALSEEMYRALPMATCIPDAWEMVQFRSIHRVPYFTNLTCLREFVPTRNVIFDNRLYDLYFRIPARIRRTGNIVRSALRKNDLRLAMLVDGNTWLPTSFPFVLHRQSKKMRCAISHVRNRLGNALGLAIHKGYGSWPRFGVLWVQNKTMQRIMDDLVSDSTMLPQGLFDHQAVREVWDQHKTGKKDHTSILNAVATFGLLHRSHHETSPN